MLCEGGDHGKVKEVSKVAKTVLEATASALASAFVPVAC